MSTFKIYKEVATLPSPLEPDALYLVRAGTGFDLYVSDATGSFAHKLNEPNIEPIEDLIGTLTPAGGIDTSITIPLGTYNEPVIANSGYALLGRYWPYDLILNNVSLTLEEAPTGADFIVDILRGTTPTSIFKDGSHLTVTDGNTGSSTYTFSQAFVDSFRLINEGELITFRVEQVGTTTAGVYPVLTLDGIRGDTQALVVPLTAINIQSFLRSDLALVGNSFPIDFQVEKILLTVQSPPTGSSLIVDIKKGTGGASPTSIFNTNLLQVDDGESSSLNSTGYSLASVTTTINKGDLLTFSITQVGSTNPSTYPVVVLIGKEI